MYEGKTVLITRPKGQGESFIAEFEGKGATVIHIPLIEIADPTDGYQALDEAIAAITRCPNRDPACETPDRDVRPDHRGSSSSARSACPPR